MGEEAMLFDLTNQYAGVWVDVKYLIEQVTSYRINAVSLDFYLTADDLLLQLKWVFLLDEGQLPKVSLKDKKYAYPERSSARSMPKLQISAENEYAAPE